MGLCLCGLCHNQQSAGVLVYAVNQAHGGVVGVISGKVPQMPSDGVDQRAAVVAASGVYHQACRLVDDHQLVVFINNVQGNVFGDDFPVALWTVKHKGDDITGLDLVVALYGVSVGADAAGFGSLLYAVAAGVGHVVHQELVHSGYVLTLVRHNAPMLVLLGRSAFFFLQKVFVQQVCIVRIAVHPTVRFQFLPLPLLRQRCCLATLRRR